MTRKHNAKWTFIYKPTGQSIEVEATTSSRAKKWAISDAKDRLKLASYPSPRQLIPVGQPHDWLGFTEPANLSRKDREKFWDEHYRRSTYDFVCAKCGKEATRYGAPESRHMTSTTFVCNVCANEALERKRHA
ncbi:MAG: hypothetical protein JRN62_03370 [Nitrososphaerota archaeon]|nr:hypothetical protein [Nitrososphaerota archaeon]MDG6948638.1 hypothetical protein [Nitrososphaerota archaeon]